MVVNAGCTDGLQGRCVLVGEFKKSLDAFLNMTSPGNDLPRSGFLLRVKL